MNINCANKRPNQSLSNSMITNHTSSFNVHCNEYKLLSRKSSCNLKVISQFLKQNQRRKNIISKKSKVKNGENQSFLRKRKKSQLKLNINPANERNPLKNNKKTRRSIIFESKITDLSNFSDRNFFEPQKEYKELKNNFLSFCLKKEIQNNNNISIKDISEINSEKSLIKTEVNKNFRLKVESLNTNLFPYNQKNKYYSENSFSEIDSDSCGTPSKHVNYEEKNTINKSLINNEKDINSVHTCSVIKNMKLSFNGTKSRSDNKIIIETMKKELPSTRVIESEISPCAINFSNIEINSSQKEMSLKGEEIIQISDFFYQSPSIEKELLVFEKNKFNLNKILIIGAGSALFFLALFIINYKYSHLGKLIEINELQFILKAFLLLIILKLLKSVMQYFFEKKLNYILSEIKRYLSEINNKISVSTLAEVVSKELNIEQRDFKNSKIFLEIIDKLLEDETFEEFYDIHENHQLSFRKLRGE